MYCPRCGSLETKDLGTIFIEDGPWDGRQYVNEGDYARYRCKPCGHVFADAPAPLKCSKCGEENVYGEVGEDCDVDPGNEGQYLCEECMPKQALSGAKIEAVGTIKDGVATWENVRPAERKET